MCIRDRADAVGAKLLVSAGYDPNAASSVWINFLPEYATLGAQKYSFLYSEKNCMIIDCYIWNQLILNWCIKSFFQDIGQ